MTTESAVREAPLTRSLLTCRLCGSSELRSFIDVHTGLDSPIGERLRRVRSFVVDEEMFLANYADVLTDLPLNDMVERFGADPGKVGALLAVPPQSAFHCVDVGDDDSVNAGRMMAYRHCGFWQPADTIKERTALEAAYQSGTRPWMLWDKPDRDPLQAAIAAINDAHRER